MSFFTISLMILCVALLFWSVVQSLIVKDKNEKIESLYNNIKSLDKEISDNNELIMDLKDDLKDQKDNFRRQQNVIKVLDELTEYQKDVARKYINILAIELDEKHKVGYSRNILKKMKKKISSSGYGDFVVNYEEVQKNLISAAPDDRRKSVGKTIVDQVKKAETKNVSDKRSKSNSGDSFFPTSSSSSYSDDSSSSYDSSSSCGSSDSGSPGGFCD